MTISRRRFLQGTAAGALLGPTVFNHLLVRRALASPGDDRYLVVIYLDGGNDGLNTITPLDDGGATLRQAYESLRQPGVGTIGLPIDVLLPIGSDPNTGAALGLHPALRGIHDLHSEKGCVAFVQGCGYPNYSLSHSTSKRTWQLGRLATPNQVSGWLGRHLAAAYGPSDVPGVTVDISLAPEMRQFTTNVLSMRGVADMSFPYDAAAPSDVAAKRAAFEATCLGAMADAQAQAAFAARGGLVALTSGESYGAAGDLYESARPSWNDRYDALNRRLGDDLREVAKVIYGVEQGVPNVTARFFQCRSPGYDTHADQGGASLDGRHGSLLAELGDSLKVFYEDLEDIGAADRVLVMVWSEFGRRPSARTGSDHGSQGPMLLIGGDVAGGVYGNHPNLAPLSLASDGNTPYSQATGDPFRSTDFRDVYGSVLKQWLGVAHLDVLDLLPVDAGPASSHWTAENFDLPLFSA